MAFKTMDSQVRVVLQSLLKEVWAFRTDGGKRIVSMSIKSYPQVDVILGESGPVGYSIEIETGFNDNGKWIEIDRGLIAG